ncbi:hypothetical protein [Chitinophaga agri]|uniref:Uncharacterized protein n=1 Tax=Chitinophaga agri TaxID=2703787 RepID=A0A6B9Z9B8_9BACT|nr:hypothetical protein [Chitinophaga agri]QHS58576.1 hypothetical protein GWR21_02885 [Chitinophaga agri]
MKTRIITVPIDKEAQYELDYDRAEPHQLIEIMIDQSEFKELDSAGVFDRINEIADAMIDDYEDDGIVEKEKLQKVLASDVFDIPVTTNKLKELKSLFIEALQRGTGVFFYF